MLRNITIAVLAVLTSTCFAEMPRFQAGLDIVSFGTHIDGQSYRVTGNVRDRSVMGYSGVDVAVSNLVFTETTQGQVDAWRVTNIVSQTDLVLVADVQYLPVGATSVVGMVSGPAAICAITDAGVPQPPSETGSFVSDHMLNEIRNYSFRQIELAAGISQITSTDGTVTVTDGTGPTADLSISGALAGYSTTGDVAQVASDLADHESATGTSVHGLGTMSVQSTGDYYNAGTVDGLLDAKAGTASVAAVAADLSSHEGLTGTAVHGLGTMSTQGTGDYYTAAAADLLLAAKAGTATVAAIKITADGAVQRTGDTNTIDLTGADVRIADSTELDNPVTRSELDTFRESITVTDFYYSTNAHPDIAGAGRLCLDIPDAYTFDTGALDAGTNILFTFWQTNTTTRIRGGILETICHVERLSGNSAAYQRFELLYTDDDGATTNVLAAAQNAENIRGAVKPYSVFKGLADDVTGTLRLGVRLSVVRAAGGSGASLRFSGGVGYPSHLATPGVGDVSGYVTVESDPIFTNSAAAGITATHTSNWQTAYGWGDHATNDYSTGTPVYVESDPVFTASVAYAISGADTGSWHQAVTDSASWTNNKLAWNDAGDLTNLPAGMINYLHVPSSTNWLSYDSATKTLSGCVTNAGGSGAGSITNVISGDGSVDITSGAGPEVDLSTTNYVQTQLAGETLAAVTARGATTPHAIIVSNNITAFGDVCSTLLRFSMKGSYQPASWNEGTHRGLIGGCTGMGALVFEPHSSAIDANQFWPWVLISKPGNDPENYYSEALRIETNGSVTIGGRLDMGGYSIVNIGTNSLMFADGTIISAQAYRDAVESAARADSPVRRVEGPFALILAWLLSKLGPARRKRVIKLLEDILKNTKSLITVLMIFCLAGIASAESVTSVKIQQWDAAITNAEAARVIGTNAQEIAVTVSNTVYSGHLNMGAEEIIIGSNAQEDGVYPVAIGYDSFAYTGVAIGQQAKAYYRYATAVGWGAVATNGGTAIGRSSYATNDSVALGSSVENNVAGTTRIKGDLQMAGDDVLGVGTLTTTNLAITGGATNGGVWVCTNSVTGEGTIKTYSKMQLTSLGQAIPSGNHHYLTWSTTPAVTVGNALTATTEGVKVERAGVYMVTANANINTAGAGSGASFGLAVGTTGINYREYIDRQASNNDIPLGPLSIIRAASSGDVFRARTYLSSGAATATNSVNNAKLFVVELP